jgi:hypothetical protein
MGKPIPSNNNNNYKIMDKPVLYEKNNYSRTVYTENKNYSDEYKELDELILYKANWI